MIDLLAAPLAGCLVIAGIHCYLGMHIVSRGIIFVDLALAQIAVLGTVVAMLFDIEPGSIGAYAVSLSFVLVGSAVFASAHFHRQGIPHEAVIGIAYAVASALAILALDQNPHGSEMLENMLTGSVLFTTWTDVGVMALIYSVISLIHLKFRHTFLQITMDCEQAERDLPHMKLWDFLFYTTLGIVVVISVEIAGVLLVFSYLVVPAVCAMFFSNTIRGRLLLGWVLGFIGSVFGLWMAASGDLPVGAAVVATFGGMLVVCAIIGRLVRTGDST